MPDIHRPELRRFLIMHGLRADRAQHIIDILDPFYRMGLEQRFTFGETRLMKNDQWIHVTNAGSRTCSQVQSISLDVWIKEHDQFYLKTYPVRLLDEISNNASVSVDVRVRFELTHALNVSLTSSLKTALENSIGETVAHSTWVKLHGLLRAWLMTEISTGTDRTAANALEQLVRQCSQGFILLGTQRAHPEVAVFLSA